MALFDTSADKFDYQNMTGAEKTPTEGELLRLSARDTLMREAIGTLELGQTVHWVSAGTWAMHDLLAYVLSQTGAADVTCFTWAVSVPGAQAVINLKDAGLIRRLDFIANYLMRKMCATAMALMQNHADKCVGACIHAKGFILANEKWRVSSIASANYSNNPTIEAGVISCAPNVYDMHRRWIDNVIANEGKYHEEAFMRLFSEKPPPPRSEKRHLYLIRGLPGSGKSTLAHSLAENVFENDDLFTNPDGSYDFKKAKEQKPWFPWMSVREAVETTFQRVKNCMEKGESRIAVANTFSTERELQPYMALAERCGYTAHVMIAENRHGGVSVHDVPAKEIDKMRERFAVKL